MAQPKDNFTEPLPTSDGKYQYPMRYNAYGQLVPIIEYSDLEDLIEKSLKLTDDEGGTPYAYRRGTFGMTPMLDTPAKFEQEFRPSQAIIDATFKQTQMHMRALEAERETIGLESSVLFKPVMNLLGTVDRDIDGDTLERITGDWQKKGVIDIAATNNPWLITAGAFQDYKAIKSYSEAQAVKETFGRALTEEEIQQCYDAGLDTSAVMAVRDYVANGKDFQKAFGLMERMTWANWARYNRRFFDIKSIASMGVEIATDPLTFIPYGLAFKAPAFLSKVMASAVSKGLREGASTARRGATKGLKDFSVGAFIGGTQGLSYASIRNWQGITEDTFSLTMGAMAFSGGISFVGGRLSKGGILNETTLARDASINMDNTARNFADSVIEVQDIRKAMDDFEQGASGFEITNMTQAEVRSLAEIDALNKELGELNGQLAATGDFMTPEELSAVRNRIGEITKRIETLDREAEAKSFAQRSVERDALRKAETIEEFRNAIPERDIELKLADNETLTKFQQKYRNLLSKIPSLTVAGTIAKDPRNWVITHAAKLMPNESGWAAVNAQGELVSATRLSKNLKDINDHIHNQTIYNLDDYNTNLKKTMVETGTPAQAIQDEVAKFLLTPGELQPKLSANRMPLYASISKITKEIGDMAEDQTKVWGDGMYTITNELGEQQLVKAEPLIGQVSHNKNKFMPAVVDENKHHDIVKRKVESIDGFDSDKIEISEAAKKRANEIVIDECDENLFNGVRSQEVLWDKFKADKDRWFDIEKSRKPNFKSPVEKAKESLKKKDEAITSLDTDIASLKNEILKKKTSLVKKGKQGTKTLENKLSKAETNRQKLLKERAALGAGDERLGRTAEEQVANLVYEDILRKESRAVATGMVSQHFERTHADTSVHGFDRPDHTIHRGAYWDYFYKGRSDTASIGDMLDTRVNIVTNNYINQMAGRLAGNEVFGAKNYREMSAVNTKWVSDHFNTERYDTLPRSDQQLIRALDAAIKGNYGISVKRHNTLGGSKMNAGPVEGSLEVFKNFTALTKGGFFWFYNMFESGAGLFAYGAGFFLKSNPLIKNKLTRAIAGESPSAKDIRFVQNRMCADELMSLNSWNRILENNSYKYGGNSFWGKVVSGSEWLYEHSPLTKMQRHSQSTPERQIINEFVPELIRFAHSENFELGKKSWGGGFINKQDIQRMGLSHERLIDLAEGFKKVSYIDEEGAPRIKTDVFDKALTPRNKATMSIISNYIRDEVIQRSSYLDGFLYKDSNASSFWDVFTQFKSFSLNSGRKKLVKSGNRVVYEGAYGETGLQFLLNAGLGTVMSQLKTVMRYNMLTDEEAKERFLELNYGVKSFSDIDFSSPDVWSRIGWHGMMDSAWFAGVQLAASYFDARSMMQRTSGGGLQSALLLGEGESPRMKKFSNTFTQNVPMFGKADELTSSANILLKYIWSPSSVSDVKKTRADAQRFLKAFTPNDPFIISPIMNALGGKYD